jgi:hypothetical protein
MKTKYNGQGPIMKDYPNLLKFEYFKNHELDHTKI